MVAEAAPSLAIEPCLRILRGTHRNSLANQETLRVLRRVHSRFEDEGKEWPRADDSRDQPFLDAVAALNQPADEAVAKLRALLNDASDDEVRGALLLALGETGSQDAFEILHERLLEEEWGSGWSAADGFLSLNTPKLMDSQLLETLVEDFGQDRKPPTKVRILYVLGRLHMQSELPQDLPFDTAVDLTQQGLRLRTPLKGRAIDLVWQLLPESEEDKEKWVAIFEPWLCRKLGAHRRGSHYMVPVWKSEWLQKRLVTALGRIGSPGAEIHLKQLREKVAARPPRTSKTTKGQRDMDRQRSELRKAIDRAIDDLHRRHL
jgi:hypothetical protein